MMGCLPPCGQLLPLSGVQPFHAVCRAPNLVAEEFTRAAGEKEYMTVEDLTKFMRTFQGDSTVTEDRVKADMIRFISWVEKTNSSRHLAKLGLSHRSYSSNRGSGSSRFSRSSKHSKQGLLGAEREPTFTMAMFLKFLLTPMYNEYRAPPSKDVSTESFL